MIILYSTNCPKCHILEDHLKKKSITYEKVIDEKLMKEKGFMTVPMLEIDREIMDFGTSIKWLNERK